MNASGGVDALAQNAWLGPYAASLGVHLGDHVESAQVDDHTAADRTARHAAAGSARHERCRRQMGPACEGDDVIGVGGDGDGERDDAADAGGLGVDGSSDRVVAEDSSEVSWPFHAQELTARSAGS